MKKRKLTIVCIQEKVNTLEGEYTAEGIINLIDTETGEVIISELIKIQQLIIHMGKTPNQEKLT